MSLFFRNVSFSQIPSTLLLDDSGFTVFTSSVDTRIVYVSNAGNDSWNGLASSFVSGSVGPKSTILNGKTLIRDTYPDWLLLKRGDTFTESGILWATNGRSSTEPQLLGTYGTGDRPLIQTGSSNFLNQQYGNTCNYIAVVGLHLIPHIYAISGTPLIPGGPVGIEWDHDYIWFLLEDCFIEKYWQNFVSQGTTNLNEHTGVYCSSLIMRRNIIVDAFSTLDTEMQVNTGIYLNTINVVLLEENIFEHNGWRTDISGTLPSWFRHNGYIQNGVLNVTVKNNIWTGTDTVMCRAGGTIVGNLSVNNYLGFLIGLGIDPEPGGVSALMYDNVTISACEYGNGGPYPPTFLAGGLAMDIGNISSMRAYNNIWMHSGSATGERGIGMREQVGAYAQYRIVHDTIISGNIFYDWGGTAFQISDNSAALAQQNLTLSVVDNHVFNNKDTGYMVTHNMGEDLSGVTASNNAFSGLANSASWFRVSGVDKTLSQWKALLTPPDTTSQASALSYPNPNRTIESYMASLGQTATYGNFTSKLREMRKGNWDTNYTALIINSYFRAGFGR